jgi:hypothetical protein
MISLYIIVLLEVISAWQCSGVAGVAVNDACCDCLQIECIYIACVRACVCVCVCVCVLRVCGFDVAVFQKVEFVVDCVFSKRPFN